MFLCLRVMFFFVFWYSLTFLKGTRVQKFYHVACVLETLQWFTSLNSSVFHFSSSNYAYDLCGYGKIGELLKDKLTRVTLVS